MTQILAIYPKNEVEIFNSLKFSVSFITPEAIYENIDAETCCIVIKDSNAGKIIEKIRKNFITLRVILVDSYLEKIDSRTLLISSAQLFTTLADICQKKHVFFNNSELNQEITKLQKFNINVLLSSQAGFYGELAAEYLADDSDLIIFDMSKKDENHLISELSAVMVKKDFFTIYISNFESILTMLSVLEWVSANKTIFSRAIFHLENQEWLNNFPESVFETLYTLQIPDLDKRPADFWAIINSYSYQYLTKDFLGYLLNNPMSEKQLIKLLNKSFDNQKQTFILKV